MAVLLKTSLDGAIEPQEEQFVHHRPGELQQQSGDRLVRRRLRQMGRVGQQVALTAQRHGQDDVLILYPNSSPRPGTPGRGVGGEGLCVCVFGAAQCNPSPSPQPLSPEYGGEGLSVTMICGGVPGCTVRTVEPVRTSTPAAVSTARACRSNTADSGRRRKQKSAACFDFNSDSRNVNRACRADTSSGRPLQMPRTIGSHRPRHRRRGLPMPPQPVGEGDAVERLQLARRVEAGAGHAAR